MSKDLLIVSGVFIGVVVAIYLALVLMAGFNHAYTLNDRCVNQRHGTWVPDVITIGLTGSCEL